MQSGPFGHYPTVIYRLSILSPTLTPIVYNKRSVPGHGPKPGIPVGSNQMTLSAHPDSHSNEPSPLTQ